MKSLQNLEQAKQADGRSGFSKVMRLPRHGYTIETRRRVVDRDIAYKVLTPALQRKSAGAVRGRHTVEITKRVVVCPCCGKERPAYQKSARQIRSRDEIGAWLFPQISLFEETADEQPEELIFNTPIDFMDKFICPRCGAESSPSRGYIDASMTVTQSGIKISRRLELQELFAIKVLPDQFCITEFEFYETITFHLKKGRTFVALEDRNGNTLQVCDISNIKVNRYSDDPILELINLYKPVNRELKKKFAKFFHAPLPFRRNEFRVEQFILMTRFVGYDAAFYNALPYAEDHHLIEKRFAKTAKKMHYALHVPDLVRKMMLPQVKSVRKVFFSNPALLFYQEELVQAWRLLEDVNLFRRFVTSEEIFYTLWYLCKLPKMIEFYTDCKEELGSKKLYEIMIDVRSTEWYVEWYLMLSEYDKKMERQKWHHTGGKKKSPFWNSDKHTVGANFSIPIPEYPSEISHRPALECCIQGYDFRRLKRSAEYIQAGKELHNCLTGWSFFYNNIYGIMKDNQYVAAVEVGKYEIIQAHTDHNGNISQNKSLKRAFDIWKKRNMLHERGEAEK